MLLYIYLTNQLIAFYQAILVRKYTSDPPGFAWVAYCFIIPTNTITLEVVKKPQQNPLRSYKDLSIHRDRHRISDFVLNYVLSDDI